MSDESCTCPPETDTRPLEGDAADVELAELFKALGHPVRLRILRLLARRGSCLCGEIVLHIPLAQSTVSQHLRTLKQAGLVRGEVEAPRVCYCLAERTIERLKVLTAAL